MQTQEHQPPSAMQGEIDDLAILRQPYSTLDEPVRETIMRDVRAVADKLRVVVLPLDTSVMKKRFGRVYANIASSPPGDEDEMNDSVSEHSRPEEQQHELGGELGQNEKEILSKLRDWDLWGPLLICLALSILLSLKAPNPKEASAVFAAVFVAVWVGSAIVTINAKLLGGTISFFQSVCVLGYCIFPMFMAALLILLLRHTPLGIGPVNFLWVVIAFLWCTRASTIFIGGFIAKQRRTLAVYPVFFFYTFLGWMVLLL
jgi:hypothetical protein